MASRIDLTAAMSGLDPEAVKEAIKLIIEGTPPPKPCGVRSIAGRLEVLRCLLHPEEFYAEYTEDEDD